MQVDRFGRRGGMFICQYHQQPLASIDSHGLTKLPLGSLIAICGTSLVSIARNFGMSLTGRGLLGIAVGMFQPGKGLILIRQQYDQG